MSASALFQTVWRVIKAPFSAEAYTSDSAINQPLFTDQDIHLLGSELNVIGSRLKPNPKQSEAMRQGEQSSRFMGSGMEYEESRHYEMGDEVRRINWRLMARTGQAYTKLYQEERQENWFILVDHRSGMRFGTRKRLKATQASRVAGYYAWLAQRSGVPVSVGRLAEGFEQSPIYEGRSSYAQVMKVLNQACPPISGDSEASINDVLIRLSHRMQAGSRLILVSDFHDVDDKTREILTALQDFLMIKAVLIQDSAETHIPNVSGLKLQSSVNQRFYQLDSPREREQYQDWSKAYFASIASHLRFANVAYYEVPTHASVNEMNRCLSETFEVMKAAG